MLDLLGDFALLGMRIKGSVMATRPGHYANTEFMKQIRNSIRREGVKPRFKYDRKKAPLFDILTANVQGLHLEDGALVTHDALFMGAFACTLTANDTTNPVVEHCSASGNITVNCVDCNPDDSSVWGMGGIVGVSRNNIAISNCKNNVKINVQNVNKADGNATRMIYVSGVVGFCEGLVTNSTNCGDINIGTLTSTGDS